MTYKEFIDNILETRGRFGCGDEYCERHHIVPKCLGGGNEEENLIDLFAREHFEAHRLLALENPKERGLQYAWWRMCQCNRSSKKAMMLRQKNTKKQEFHLSKQIAVKIIRFMEENIQKKLLIK